MTDILQVSARGLTYDGQIRHVVINYALILLTVLPFAFARSRPRRAAAWPWGGCLGLAFGVQVLLWFTLGASGVSIVWCALAGYALMGFLRAEPGLVPQSRVLTILALGSAAAGILYYALTFPALTTIAHLCAVVLGIGTFGGVSYLVTRPTGA